MPRFQSDNDARRLGEALAALRRDRALSQAEAGRRAGMTSQGWGLYETGKRSGLYRPDVQRRLTAALGATPEELLAWQGAPGMASEGRAFDHGAAIPRRLQLSNDDLAPWAASGVVVEYEPGRWPRREQGCVIEMADGEIRVRVYEGAGADVLTVRGGPGGLETRETIIRSETRAVSAVVARLEP
ncbi:MAG: helix-turn-helix domain-containing protein [Alphaproteobacteria bacterium]|jgi:transcriptional regulator with XRE-family HTH domain|nr:helix-turn-helix domain-containing protein [Alphaproteobacteria bacterium]MBU2042327.1 helix-turn-helix domain-containing protein [Alphaproteobacteria bacterium]MBU2124771.1 helix-turn-helix domain-containing protein [Alphaproteobacteria bacterium]MBU2208035.1 helix-turn-helix domain-containing protein [Alphaproteobacteria bacterium]MBU2292183.1 helix-turn-helix domain-containing protein [Alphaproteobacteria bacterium]